MHFGVVLFIWVGNVEGLQNSKSGHAQKEESELQIK